MSKTLTVYLAADLKRFTGPLNRAGNELKGFDAHLSRLGSTLSGAIGPGIAAAAAAAAYAAVQFGQAGVQAFLDDEAAAAKLAQTMNNLGLAMDTTGVEAHIDALQRQSGVADDLLRPAMDRLLRSTRDVEQANKMLSLAMDISAGTGKTLDQTVQALSRAWDGNTTALGKLGTGIDSATLKSGDMKKITDQLSSTFDGQAATAAGTYQGQINRLKVGFSELQEALGRGLVTSMGDMSDSTQQLMKAMQDLEPFMESVGQLTAKGFQNLGNVAEDTSTLAKAVQRYKDSLDDTTVSGRLQAANMKVIENAVRGLTEPFAIGATTLDVFVTALQNLGIIAKDTAFAINTLQGEIISLGGGDFAETMTANQAATARWNAIVKDNGKTVSYTGGNLKEWLESLKKVPPVTGSAAAQVDILTEALNTQTSTVSTLQGLYDEQISKLTEATSKVKAYSDNLAASLLSGVNLGEAQKVGADLGIGTLQAFDQQIEQYRWFGNVLTEIKRQGGDQALIDQVASLGPAAGGALGQEMIDNGLIKTFSDKLVDVQASAALTASAMVPDFLLAGVDAAQGFVTAAGKQLEAEQTRLKEIGKAIGKPIGNRIKVEIAEAVADAVKAAEAAKSAAAAERAAETARNNAVVSDQAIAQALARLVANSNARTGYSMGVPVPSPVLG